MISKPLVNRLGVNYNSVKLDNWRSLTYRWDVATSNYAYNSRVNQDIAEWSIKNTFVCCGLVCFISLGNTSTCVLCNGSDLDVLLATDCSGFN